MDGHGVGCAGTFSTRRRRGDRLWDCDLSALNIKECSLCQVLSLKKSILQVYVIMTMFLDEACRVRFEVFTAVAMKYAVVLDI
jgi:hypothetical protein